MLGKIKSLIPFFESSKTQDPSFKNHPAVIEDLHPTVLQRILSFTKSKILQHLSSKTQPSRTFHHEVLLHKLKNRWISINRKSNLRIQREELQERNYLYNLFTDVTANFYNLNDIQKRLLQQSLITSLSHHKAAQKNPKLQGLGLTITIPRQSMDF